MLDNLTQRSRLIGVVVENAKSFSERLEPVKVNFMDEYWWIFHNTSRSIFFVAFQLWQQ